MTSKPVSSTGTTIEKSAFDMSKKMLFEHLTFTRAVEVSVLGATTASLPSFGVKEVRTCETVAPLSVDNRMLTEGQLTGAAVVLPTFQVTVCVLPMFHVTAVFGAVTANGPEVAISTRVDDTSAVAHANHSACHRDAGIDIDPHASSDIDGDGNADARGDGHSTNGGTACLPRTVDVGLSAQ